MQSMVDLRKSFVQKRRKIMKRFTVLLAILGVLVFSAFFQAWSESRAEAKKASIAPVYDSTGAMLEAINAKGSERKIAPVYDATGAMLEAINPKAEQKAQSVPEAGAQGVADYIRAHSNSSAQVVPDASVQSVADYIRLHSNDLSFREYQLGERYGVMPQQYYRNKFLDECSDVGLIYRAQCLSESQASTP